MMNSGLQQANIERMTTSQPTTQTSLFFPGCSSNFMALYTKKEKKFDSALKLKNVIKLKKNRRLYWILDV